MTPSNVPQLLPLGSPAGTAATDQSRRTKVVPLRHAGRWVGGAIAFLLAAMTAREIISNPRFEWGVVGHYLAAGPIIRGLMTTLELTALAMLIGIVFGMVLAIMRLSENPVSRAIAWLYIGLFRGTPVLVQLIFWFNLSALFPHMAIGLPFGPPLLLVDVNALITPFAAAVLGLGLNEGAYMAEIVRSGILSVSPGQRQAAGALGLSRAQTMRRIVLPQAMRVIIPPTGNQVVGMLKMTSIVSVIAMSELLYSAQAIYTQTYETIPLLLVVSIWYLTVTSILTVGQSFIEKRYAHGSATPAPSSFSGRLRRNLISFRSVTP
ncbi:amino acid ABC transporter permease [Arthrobacter sp. A2-55]|uniref:amino acid ABC transporter permease n=1 Tax=Arthrobacter sp. A2-55 TaxID=2897337 RepID=UPI0021CDE62F|nr:amino acid ABC transporter permease [Arthrobacter sp. A2-55]MCU6479972.1 amino acid ABC transporter permease [Arthrobacter sp. A2-55]